MSQEAAQQMEAMMMQQQMEVETFLGVVA